MAEIILPPEEEQEETPQAPELNIDKPTENSKVIKIEFEAKKTNKASTKDTNQQLYTTDTDAWFEFKETSLEGANGTYSVVFRNRHDGSIFQRTGDVVDGVAYYKIPHQEIRHAGAWRGQIVYTLENGNTTAREFDYVVKGHILDGKDVREIVVEDFETLMSQLNSMRDNAELELANLVNTAEQNETDRQSFFDDLVEDIDELQANYQELLDTGVLQTNINTKLEALEEEYAPQLTEVTAQLAQKATKGEIALSDLNKNKVQFDGTWFNDEFLEDLSNGEINTTFLEDGSVTSEKLANDSVNDQKTTFAVASKNLFDGKYLPWALAGKMDVRSNVFTEEREHARSAFVRLKKQTDYTISKEVSNRFRVAFIDKVPEHSDRVYFIRDDVQFEDSGTEFTFNSGDNSYVIITVSNNVNYIEEPFLQIEEGIVKTDWETSGYRFTKEAKWFSELNKNDDYGKFDTLSVESFRTGSETDSEVIQSAFDNADGKVVSFDSGRLYNITETVVAQAGIVRGINGNNATLIVQSDITGLRYEGTLTGTANPSSSNNKELDLKESNAYIKRLRVTSSNGYEGNGIEIEKLLSANLENCHVFNLRNGIVIKGRNRNLIFGNCHVRDNLENGLLFENVNLHQLNMTGMHVGYCRNGITVIDGEIANWQMSACDIESNVSDAYGNSESLINIRTTEGGSSTIWEINFSALTLQDHGRNIEPLINIDLKRGELANLVIGSSHISNSRQSHPLIYINGGKRIGLNNITMKNDNPLDNSIVLGNDNDGIIITNNHLPAPITYGNVNNLIISNNIATGFTLEEVDDGNILIANNL